jgi:hypothetical protein
MSEVIVCKEYQQLEIQHKSARLRYAQYAYEANRLLRGTSEQQTKRIIKEELANMASISNQMLAHRQKCPVCKGETAESHSPA